MQYEKNVGAEYGEHIRNTRAICNTSASHTYGNVLAVVEKFLLDQFPQDLFKTVTASTTLAARQLTHVPSQLYKKEMPIMVLVPRITFGQDDRFLGNTLINSRVTNTQSFYGDGSLIPLAEDPRKHIWVHGHYNRAVMNIDVILSFNTFNEQVNWMSYIHNMFPINHNQFIRAPLELFIPSDFCSLIGNVSNNPIRDDHNSIYNFLSYMNSIWHYPITYKLKGGSNSDEFFMYYIADIDTTIQAPEAGPGNKDGQIKRGFDISFTIKCEFNTIGYFTLNSPNLKKPVHVSSGEDQSIISIFTDSIDLRDFDLPIGWSILGWPIFKLKAGENSISIAPILNQSLNIVIEHHLQFGIPMEQFIKIQFRENGEILNNEMFYIDWANRKLVILKPNIRRTYRLIITVSHEYVNNLIKNLYGLE
jgi:hypothetical protein